MRVVTVFFFLSSPAINRKNTPSHRRRTRSSSSGNRAAAARHGRVTALAKLKYEMPPPNTRYVLEPFEYFYTGTPCMCACVCRRIKRDCRDRKRAHERSISRDRRRFFANDRRRRISLVWNGLLYRDRGGGGMPIDRDFLSVFKSRNSSDKCFFFGRTFYLLYERMQISFVRATHNG